MPNRNLSPNVAKGMFGGPRGKKGNYITGNISQSSGAVEKMPSTVNGNVDTVRKVVKSRAKKV